MRPREFALENLGNSPDSTHYSSCGEWDRLSGYRSSLDGFETPRGYDTDGSIFARSTASRKSLACLSGSSATDPMSSVSRIVHSSVGLNERLDHENRKLDDDASASDKFSDFDSHNEFDSMFGDATDDEDATASTVFAKSIARSEKMSSGQSGQLLLNSEVVFGAGDWDEFVEEAERIINDNEMPASRAIGMQSDNRVLDDCDPSKSISTFVKDRIVNEEAHLDLLETKSSFLSIESQKQGLATKGLSDLPHTEEDVQRGNMDANCILITAPQSLLTDNIKETKLLLQVPHAQPEELSVAVENQKETTSLFRREVLEDKMESERGGLAPSHKGAPNQQSEEGKESNSFEIAERQYNSLHILNHNAQLNSPKNGGREDLGPDEISRYVEALDVNESYVDTVLDMEEVLLDSGGSEGRFSGTSKHMVGKGHKSADDQSLLPSTSGTDGFSGFQHIHKFDHIEVVGAKQRRGSSLGERLVGVKEYTVYQIKVYSGKHHWEVERRYRDFLAFYRQLKQTLSTQGIKNLPSPWQHVEKETYKIFGNVSPTIVHERSILIQECLVALIQAGSPFDRVTPLFWFLLPQRHTSDTASGSEENTTVKMQELLHGISHRDISHGELFGNSPEYSKREEASHFGKTIRLIVHVHPQKSLRQLLEAQHNSCAGCYRRFDVAKSLVQEFAQTFGWGKPRICEYTGQLFCTSCHLNESAVLPAQVLHNWDFTLYPVSQLAKAYLDSIYDQPMLCVSAVNPFLYSRVPLLVHVIEMRRKLSIMISHVRCPYRSSFQRRLGSRKYLLETSDFFALRELVDLSKGAFSTLPSLMEVIFKKLLMHITRQCCVCQEGGQSCGAQWNCENPSCLILPFQESDQCKSCGLLFHPSCFRKFGCSQCAVKHQEVNASEDTVREESSHAGNMDTVPSVKNDIARTSSSLSNISLRNNESTSNKGFFKDLLVRATQNVTWKQAKKSAVLNMASLSSNSGL